MFKVGYHVVRCLINLFLMFHGRWCREEMVGTQRFVFSLHLHFFIDLGVALQRFSPMNMAGKVFEPVCKRILLWVANSLFRKRFTLAGRKLYKELDFSTLLFDL